MACMAFVALHSCTDPDQLGLGVLPASDKLNIFFADTATVSSRVVPGDSVITSNILVTHLLGSHTDPRFGRTDVGIYAQLGFSFNPKLGDTNEVLTADSIVLTMEYSTVNTFASYYGNINTPMKFSVYRVTEDMHADSIYYSNRTFATEATPIGTATIVPAPNDSVSVYGINRTPHIRIRLNDALATEILALNNTSTFQSTTAWLDYFKGVYIKTEPVNVANEGSLIQFYLFGTQSAMTLYYHSDTPGDDSLRYSFLFNAMDLDHYDHVYTGSDAGRQLQDSTFNDSINYVQGVAGVRTHLQFPHLKDFLNGGLVAINKAEIIIPAEESELYLPPSYIRLLAVDSLSRGYLPIDFFNQESTFYGGGYDATAKTYTFIITRQIQAMVDSKIPDYGFYVVVPFLAVSGSTSSTAVTMYRMQPNSVVISSSKNVGRPVQMKISYTRLD